MGMFTGAVNTAPANGLVMATLGGMATLVLKVAVMVLLAFITTLSGFNAEFVSPVQLTKNEPAAGVAVSVTLALFR